MVMLVGSSSKRLLLQADNVIQSIFYGTSVATGIKGLCHEGY